MKKHIAIAAALLVSSTLASAGGGTTTSGGSGVADGKTSTRMRMVSSPPQR